MNLIKEFFWGCKPKDITELKWDARRAVRALIKHGDKIAVVKSTKYDFYKCLPGGGVEGNETLQAALHREIQEEVGCDIKVIGEIGMCVEYVVNDNNLIQTSFVFVAEVVGKIGKPHFTEKEIAAGFILE